MIIVHDIFVCKPGNASKVAKMMKEAMADRKNVSVMTDVVGQYNRVVMASWYGSVSEWDAMSQAYMNPTPEMKASMEKMKDMHDMYLTGSREIYRTW
jgi:hypothetical protein